MRALAVALAVTALTFGAYADDLPDPPGCTDFSVNATGDDPACNEAIAKQTDPAAKSVLLYRRAYAIDDKHDFKTYPKAFADLTEAIRLMPTNWRALQERAYLHNEYGRWAEAEKDSDARIALMPQDPQGYQERAMARFNLGDVQGHYDDYNAVAMLRPGVAGPLIYRADAALWIGRFDQATKDLDTAATLGAKTAKEASDADAVRADIAILTKTSAGGAKACIDAGATDPRKKDTFVGDCTRAFLDATTPKAKADALTLRGIGWLNLGNEGNARADDVVAAALDPDNPGTHSNLAFAYMRDHHSTGAIWEFDRSIAIKPTFIAYAGRASAKHNLHDLEGAFADAKKSFEIKPNLLALWVLGDVVYEKTKSYDEAKMYWIGAYRLGSRDDRLIQRLKDAGVSIPPPDDPPKK